MNFARWLAKAGATAYYKAMTVLCRVPSAVDDEELACHLVVNPLAFLFYKQIKHLPVKNPTDIFFASTLKNK
ncbi:MAG: hypothetical protein MK165_20895 [Pirellulaceae bacterium]|nr:hypothetical protein [Pirellulaceae bacterium]